MLVDSKYQLYIYYFLDTFQNPYYFCILSHLFPTFKKIFYILHFCLIRLLKTNFSWYYFFSLHFSHNLKNETILYIVYTIFCNSLFRIEIPWNRCNWWNWMEHTWSRRRKSESAFQLCLASKFSRWSLFGMYFDW